MCGLMRFMRLRSAYYSHYTGRNKTPLIVGMIVHYEREREGRERDDLTWMVVREREMD